MDLEKGMVVKSRAGHDKGRFMAVVDIKDGAAYVCDGKERPLDAPKKKNPRHLAKTHRTVPLERLTNRQLRTLLRETAAKESEEKLV